jgi:hypothetical protein
MLQKRPALFYFLGLRVTITRRAAFEYVGDENLHTTAQTYAGQHIVQQFARLPHKRLATCIFFGTRRFTDNDPIGGLRTNTKNGLCTGLTQSAGLAAGDLGL